MKTLDDIMETLHSALARATVEDYIARRWVRPIVQGNSYYFEDIDIARIQLIQQLRHDMQVGDDAMDIVLSLLDQMHGLRARMRTLAGAIERQPQHVQAEIFALLTGGSTE